MLQQNFQTSYRIDLKVKKKVFGAKLNRFMSEKCLEEIPDNATVAYIYS